MAKKKLYKLDEQEKQNISSFKKAVEKELERSNPFNSFTFEEAHTKSDYKISAVVDYGEFKAIVFYNPLVFITDMIDVEFDLGAKYKYNIYSVFNLFDIDDFNQYYYRDILEKGTFDDFVHSIFEMINKYSYDIKKACEPSNLARLEEITHQDYKDTYKKMSEDEIDKFRLDEFSLDVVHPNFSDASDCDDTEKLLKKLQKKNSKGKLDTLYERRLLEFLQNGNQIQNKAFTDYKKNTSTYSKLMLKTVCIEMILPLILSVGAVFYNIYYEYAGAFLPGGYNQGHVLYAFIMNNVFLVIASFFFMTLGLNLLFSKILIKKFSNNDPKIMSRYDKEHNDSLAKFLKKLKKPLSIIFGCIIIIVGIIMVSIVAQDNIGFYDNYVKFYSETTSQPCEVDYNDIKIINVLGYYDEDTEEYTQYTESNSYIIAKYDDEYYYVLENLDPNGETDKYIKDLAYEYNIEIGEVKSAADYAESIGTDGE